MKRTLVLTMGVVVMVALVGCGGNNPAGPASQSISAQQEGRFFGIWEMRVSGDVASRPSITFKKGGEVDVTASTEDGTPLTVSGTYKVDENKLTMTANFRGKPTDTSIAPILERFTTYTYSIEDNTNGKLQLILKSPDGEETRWEKD